MHTQNAFRTGFQHHGLITKVFYSLCTEKYEHSSRLLIPVLIPRNRRFKVRCFWKRPDSPNAIVFVVSSSEQRLQCVATIVCDPSNSWSGNETCRKPQKYRTTRFHRWITNPAATMRIVLYTTTFFCRQIYSILLNLIAWRTHYATTWLFTLVPLLDFTVRRQNQLVK